MLQEKNDNLSNHVNILNYAIDPNNPDIVWKILNRSKSNRLSNFHVMGNKKIPKNLRQDQVFFGEFHLDLSNDTRNTSPVISITSHSKIATIWR